MPQTLEAMTAWRTHFLAGRQSQNASFVTYLIPDSPEKMAALFLVAHQTGFMDGRFCGSWMMKRISAPKLLSLFGVGALICTLIAIGTSGIAAVVALVLVGFFNSIMFPTIFALSLKNLGGLTKRASSLLVMSIIGGGLIPAAMGKISDLTNIQRAFVVPLICYLYVIYFAVTGYRPEPALAVPETAAVAEAK